MFYNERLYSYLLLYKQCWQIFMMVFYYQLEYACIKLFKYDHFILLHNTVSTFIPHLSSNILQTVSHIFENFWRHWKVWSQNFDLNLIFFYNPYCVVYHREYNENIAVKWHLFHLSSSNRELVHQFKYATSNSEVKITVELIWNVSTKNI